MTARLLSLAREAATSRGDARTAARLALTEALREERADEAWPMVGVKVGYLCADGTRAHTLRAAVRSWTAAATGRTPGHPGRPQTRAPAPPREPKTPRTSVTVRLPEDVLAWCRANGGVTAALERSVRAMMAPTSLRESMTSYRLTGAADTKGA